MARDLLTAGIELDLDTEVERQLRMEDIKAELARMFTAQGEAAVIDKAMSLLVGLERENERLAWRLLRAMRYRFGRSTERLSKEDLAQLFLALGGDEDQVKADGDLAVPAPAAPPEETVAGTPPPPAAGEAPPEKKRRQRKASGATRVGRDVERVTTPVPVPAAERTCALCGKEKVTFGYVDHERIEFVPAKVVVHVERREKCACTACRKDVSVADRSEIPNVTRRVGASMLAKMVADKCAMALPLHRQRKELERMGLFIAEKTMASYWAYTTDLLEPIAISALADVFGADVVGTDDSVLKTLDKRAKGGSYRGHLWCFVGTDALPGAAERVGYGYTPSWQATDIADWFGAMDGWIQCDGYAGYSSETDDEDGKTVVAVPNDRRLGCGMHVRSKFHAALLARDPRAAVPLKHFADLYLIEADCKARGLDVDARGEVRRTRSLPILDALDAWVDAIHPRLLPKSPLRRATTYAINQRVFFRRCFEDGRFEIDNGRTERRIRNCAVGRRNFLFTGSARGGERLAIAYTLVDNCLILGVDPRRYLEDVITKREAGWPLARLSQLTPHRWAADHPPENRAE
ncbi:MAG: IS66 family transposase [Myxococcales bacterium]